MLVEELTKLFGALDDYEFFLALHKLQLLWEFSCVLS